MKSCLGLGFGQLSLSLGLGLGPLSLGLAWSCLGIPNKVLVLEV